MAVIGAEDPYTPPEDVEALRAAGAEIVVYPEASHGFVHDPSRPAHRADDAADAWARCLAFLRS
jgi:carboxymethylenebutenolidase